MKDVPELMFSDLLLSVMCTVLNLLSISYSLCSYLAHCLKIKESVSVWLLSLKALMRVYYSGVPYPIAGNGLQKQKMAITSLDFCQLHRSRRYLASIEDLVPHFLVLKYPTGDISVLLYLLV